MASATDYERQLHERLLQKEETASAELCCHFLEPLIQRFKRIFWDVALRDETLICDAVTDALLNYIDNPSQYDPQRRSLEGYLKMSAEGDLKNALDKEKRRQEHFEKKPVELSLISRKGIMKGESTPEQQIVTKEIQEQLQRIFPEKSDQGLADAILSGVRETSHYVEILGITHLPEHEQRIQVKRAKDRIKVKLKRTNWNKL
ncbi:hypothetical protein U27_01003 [Candidatus Vecturithrix granuli]|uniref:Uncharacterized protein n=1 Tax=Vecturithrix granuli TaxID=1499967 RepID=A0A081C950_VECG1|nr:hypothetical protein U27_01003 [Candidatus Vecturithrix granuli]